MRNWQWIAIPLGVLATSRILSTALLLHGLQGEETVRVSLTARYLDVVSTWDGGWYRQIAEIGYPSTLPTEDGVVTENAWAFPPGYSMLVRGLMRLTGLGFPVAATFVSVTCACLAMLLLYRLMRQTGGAVVGLASVVAVCFYPASPVLQLAYSESLALLLLVAALTLLRKQRYCWAIPVVIALGLTRQMAVVFGAVAALHFLARWRGRKGDPFLRDERVALGSLVAICVAASLAWPATAWVVTGNPDAYMATHAVWWFDHQAPGPHNGWLATSLKEPGVWSALVLLLLCSIALVGIPDVSRSWGLEVRAWSVVYPLYVLVATRPSPSVVRYLMLSIGLFAALPMLATQSPGQAESAIDRRRLAGIFLLATAGAVAQYWWVTRVFLVEPGSTTLFP